MHLSMLRRQMQSELMTIILKLSGQLINDSVGKQNTRQENISW